MILRRLIEAIPPKGTNERILCVEGHSLAAAAGHHCPRCAALLLILYDDNNII